MSRRLHLVPAVIDAPAAPDPQERYARWLAWGTRVGFVLLIVGFGLYVFGAIEPHVAHGDLPALWNQPVAHYLNAARVPTGWGWLSLVHRADIFNLVGIAILSSCSLPALAAALASYARAGDRVFVALCGLEMLVLALAASNLLAVGH